MQHHDRIPPENLASEMIVLGSILVDPSLMTRVAATVRPADFYSSLNESIFQAMFALYERGEVIDKVALAQELRDRGLLDNIGGIGYINALMDTVPTTASVDGHAKIVAECAALRELGAAGRELVEIMFASPASEADAALSRGLGIVQAAVDRSSSPARKPLSLFQASYELEQHFATGRGIAHPTPYAKLNTAIGGWIPGTLTVLGGSPKMGKSFLAQTIVAHLATSTGGCVPFFPLKLGRTEQQLRFEQMYSRVSSLKRTMGHRLTESERERIEAARDTFAQLDVPVFDGFPQFGTQDIVVACRRLAADKRLTGIFIDHIGFLRDVRLHGRDTKHDRIEQALSSLLEMARQLAVPVFIVWHVNRDAKDGEPTIFHLRDGGNVEGYAHNILFVHRPRWDMADGSQRDGNLIIAATRSGMAGKLSMHFDDQRGVWCTPDGRAFFDPEPPTQTENGLIDYANARLADASRTIETIVDGRDARIVVDDDGPIQVL